MPTIAQGVTKLTVFKKQTGIGVPASGSGGQVMRREKSEFKLDRDSFENNEIVQHQQSTGIAPGMRKVSGSLSGVVSPNTYSTLISSLLRKSFTATAAFAASTITISGTAALWTFTASVAAPLFLTNGLKIGDVIRLSAAGGTAGNKANNILVMGVTSETVFTGITLNASALTAEAITTCTVTVTGKKSIVPLTGHTKEYWTVEEWYPDISRSELFTDVMPASIDIGLPSNGNSTFAASFVGLNRTLGSAQVLTTPTAATTTAVQTAVNGSVLVNGIEYATITAASIMIDGSTTVMDGVIGSNVAPDNQRGRIKVSGSITALFENGAFSVLYDNATAVNMVIIAAADNTNASEFCAYSMSAVRFTGDTPDDGEKGIIRTLPFTAEINAAGGATLANDQTIISIQDSLAA